MSEQTLTLSSLLILHKVAFLTNGHTQEPKIEKERWASYSPLQSQQKNQPMDRTNPYLTDNLPCKAGEQTWKVFSLLPFFMSFIENTS